MRLKKKKCSHWLMTTCLKGISLQVNTGYHETGEENMGSNNDCHTAETPGLFADIYSCQTCNQPPALLQHSYFLLTPLATYILATYILSYMYSWKKNKIVSQAGFAFSKIVLSTIRLLMVVFLFFCFFLTFKLFLNLKLRKI